MEEITYNFLSLNETKVYHVVIGTQGDCEGDELWTADNGTSGKNGDTVSFRNQDLVNTETSIIYTSVRDNTKQIKLTLIKYQEGVHNLIYRGYDFPDKITDSQIQVTSDTERFSRDTYANLEPFATIESTNNEPLINHINKAFIFKVGYELRQSTEWIEEDWNYDGSIIQESVAVKNFYNNYATIACVLDPVTSGQHIGDYNYSTSGKLYLVSSLTPENFLEMFPQGISIENVFGKNNYNIIINNVPRPIPEKPWKYKFTIQGSTDSDFHLFSPLADSVTISYLKIDGEEQDVTQYVHASDVLWEFSDGNHEIFADVDSNEYLFNDNEGITNLTVNEGVEVIGAQFCQTAPNLEQVSLPLTLTEIQSYAFDACESLSSVIYNGTTYTNRQQLENALVQNNVTLGDDVFEGTNLT